MKLAVIADIHGNIRALEAVLEHIERSDVDEIIVAGDVVNVLPDAKACWDRVSALACPMLLGNHERYVFSYGTPDAEPVWHTERFQLLRWMQAQFSADDLATMRQLPLSYRQPGLLVVHATPRSEFGGIFDHTPRSEVEEMFAGVQEPLVIRGHNHTWRETPLAKTTVVTVGALGLPLNGRREAQYALLEQRSGAWRYQAQYVPYDHRAVLKELNTSDYFEHAGPIGHIFAHELAEARPHILLFFKQYLRAVDSGELSLAQAVKRYLNG